MDKNKCLLTILASTWLLAQGPEVIAKQACDQPPTAIETVRVFDGRNIIEDATVVIECGKIADVSRAGQSADLAEMNLTINGDGRTLIPGLIDAHAHTFRREMLTRSLRYGVTTALDMGSVSKTFVKSIKEEDRSAPAVDRADLFSGVLWVTAPGSHGTQFGEVPTLSAPEDAAEFVDQRIADGADFIKIIYDNFRMFDRPIPTLSKETLFAVVEAAHDRGKIAVVHSRDVDAYADVVEAGADGFFHLPVDAVPNDDLVRAVKENAMFVTPNLSLTRHEGPRLIDDPVIGPMLNEREVEGLNQFRLLRREGGDEVEYGALLKFHQAGVMVLAGSDSPNPGTTPGASIHLEMELMVEAGLAPMEALKAATSNPAKAFGLTDRGRIAEGLIADLLLVEGQPDQNITDTRRIVKVWKSGVLQSDDWVAAE